MTQSADHPVEECLMLSVEGSVAILKINRPEKLNALNDTVIAGLAEHVQALDRRSDVRAVIITGTGERAFSAGGDIASWSAMSALDFGRFWIREGHQVFDAIARLRHPVIAVLNGHALGGGLELAATADYRIAEEHVLLGQPEAGLGIIPGWSGTQRAVRRFGAQLVRRVALFGEMMAAKDALQEGVVDEVVDRGSGLKRARELAETLNERSPVALEIIKMLINTAEGEERERVLDAFAGSCAAASPELREGISAFRAKRKPNFNLP